MTERGVLLFLVLALLYFSPLRAAEGNPVPALQLTSTAFANGAAIPKRYSCDAGELSPPLSISGVPGEARSLALIVDDPDAPGGVWVHWVLWNIDPRTAQVAGGSIPAGARQGLNSWQRTGYGAPCPPSGTHRYVFRLFALKERLELPAGSSREDLERAMRGKILSRCEMLGLYGRK